MNENMSAFPGGGSLRDLLGKHLGRLVTASFLIGSRDLVRQQGILAAVGTDYIVLRQPEGLMTGDLYALKFMEFHTAGAEIPPDRPDA